MKTLTFSRKVRGIERIKRNSAQALADRARRYVEKMPEAISGSGGHDALFAVASVLIHGFDLPEADAWQILIEYNARCQPPWSERELRHKLSSAGKLTRPSKPRGHLLGGEEPLKKYFPVPPKAENTIWHVKIEPLPGKDFQVEQSGSPSEITAISTVADDDPEARRIANELVRIHRDAPGGLTAADAAWFAAVLKTFEATYTGRALASAPLASAPQGTNPDDVAELERLHRKKYGQRT